MTRSCLGEKDVSEIIPKLWLGNYKSALSRKFINKHNIKYIINVTKNIPNLFEKDGIKYLNIKINDIDTRYQNINDMLDLCNKFISDALQKNNGILVHCKKGHHRSASIVASYLIKNLKYDYVKAILLINSIRKCALSRNACMLNGVYKYYIEHTNINS